MIQYKVLLQMISFKRILIALAIFPSVVFADRIKLPLSEIKKWKMQPVEYLAFEKVSTRIQIPKELSQLSFPLRSGLNDQSEFGPIMHQYQDGTWPAYFHAGIDIRGQAAQAVITPVEGVVEAGYYAYNDEENGKSTKYFLSLKDALAGRSKPPWGKLYFEVAVINSLGYRFEFHHIDPDTLPTSILQKALLDEGTSSRTERSVQAGEVVGALIRWPNSKRGLSYNHLHYNVVSPAGIYINPLNISIPIGDKVPPTFVDFFSVSSFCGRSIPKLEKHLPGTVLETQKYFVMGAFDLVSSSRFPHPPTWIQVKFGRHSTFEYDFSQSLSDSNGLLPDIQEVYLPQACDHEGKLRPASGSFEFFFKIPVPSQFSGPVQVIIGDQSGNKVEQILKVSNPESL